MAIGPIKKGALHSQLGIPQSDPIPTSTLRADIEHAKKGSKLKKRLDFALNARKWDK